VKTFRSFTITELLIALAIFAVVASSIIFVTIDALEAGRVGKDRSIALAFAQEGLEAARSIRNRNYNELINGTYGLSQAANQWRFSPTPENLQNRFTRAILVEDYAANEKKLTSRIIWQLRAGRNLKIELVSILSNWKTFTPPPPWANPRFAGSLDLPGTANALRVAVVDSTAYLVRASSGQREFYIINVTNPAAPSLLGSLELGASGRDLVVSGNYAYVASEHNNQELQIINLTNPASPTLAGSYNAPGNENALGIAFKDNRIYLTRASSATNPEFLRIDVTNPANPVLLNSLNFSGNPNLNSIAISENYAFVATSDNSRELQIVNINEAVPLSVIGNFNTPGNQDGLAVEIFDANTVLLGRVNVTSAVELYILNVTNKTSPSQLASFETGAAINDLAFGQNHLLGFLATANTNQEFQVVSDLRTAPILRSALNLSDIPNGVFYSPNNDTAYLATNINSQELVIILPQ